MIYFTFPETKNLTIEEIAIVFDGERAMGLVDVVGNEGLKGAELRKGDDITATEHIGSAS